MKVTEFREFNDQPRRSPAIEIGPFSVELGKRQRTCRACRAPIVKGEYHLAIGFDPEGASLKVCGYCIFNLSLWIRDLNEKEV